LSLPLPPHTRTKEPLWLQPEDVEWGCRGGLVGLMIDVWHGWRHGVRLETSEDEAAAQAEAQAEVQFEVEGYDADARVLSSVH
jgi:hypothetical protein